MLHEILCAAEGTAMGAKNSVLYTMSPEEVRKTLEGLNHTDDDIPLLLASVNRWEIWEGLPDEYTFVPTLNRGGHPSWRAEADGVYIWVNAEARQAIEQNPSTLLYALGVRIEGKLDIMSVDVARYASADECIDHARQLNVETIRQSERYKKIAARKKEEKK